MKGRLVQLGIFAAITFGITAWIGLQILKLETGDNNHFSARFDDVTGLFVGDDVKLAGVPVGQVRSIRTVDGEAEIEFSVDAGIDLPVDSEVAVKWRNLIGQRYLYVYPGEDAALLEDGMEMTETRSVVDLGQLINSLGPLAQSIDPEQLNEMFNAIAAGLDGNQPNIDSILTNLDLLLATLSERDQTLQLLLEDYDVVTGAVAQRDTQIQSMIDNLVLLSQSFADNTGLVDDAIVQLAAFSGDLDALLTANGDELASILADLGVVTDTVVGKLPELEAAFEDLPRALTSLHSTVDGGEYLRVNALCISPDPAPCPHPIVIGEDSRGRSGGATEARSPTGEMPAPGPGRLDSLEAFSQLLLGSLP